MGAALSTAAASNAYVLSDRGTWLSFKNRGDLKISVEGDKRLFNQYGVIPVNPERHPHVKKGLHRVAHFAGGTEGHCRLQDRRRAIVLSERGRSERVNAWRGGGRSQISFRRPGLSNRQDDVRASRGADEGASGGERNRT